MKFVRVRAIIVVDGKLAVMYRNVEGREFFTFPGGCKEKFETDVDCIIREVREEFGIDVAPIKKLYDYENKGSIEHFYLCAWLTGNFGTGTGEEFKQNNIFGEYSPTFIDIKDIPFLPLMPKEIATKFYLDYKKNKFDFINTKVIPGCLAK